MTTHKRTTYARTGTHNIIIYNATRDELPPPPPRDERAVWRWWCAHTSPRCRRTYVNCTPHTSSSVYYTIDSRQARLNPMRTLKRLHTHTDIVERKERTSPRRLRRALKSKAVFSVLFMGVCFVCARVSPLSMYLLLTRQDDHRQVCVALSHRISFTHTTSSQSFQLARGGVLCVFVCARAQRRDN